MKTTRTQLIRTAGALLLGAWLTIPTLLQAQAPPPSFTGHYPAGAEGIKAGSLPPPGFYVRDYNIFYFADRLPGGPSDFEVFAYVNGFRAIWISNFKILGGFYGADVLVPFGYSKVKAPSVGLDDSAFSLGDVHVEPITLSWHPQKFDFAVGYAFWAPTGDFDPNHPARLAKGFWSHMFTAGATWYVDEEKTWALSVLNRYEIHTENEDFDITPGNSYTLEWGASKSLTKTLDVGVVGYWQQQTTRDSGAGASRIEDRVVAVGPEVSAVIPKLGVIASLRYLREFAAKDRPEGNTVTLTLTKRF